MYRGKLVLYGCGDFIDDYEGITGYEEYRDDLRLLYLVAVAPDTGELAGIRMVPMRARRMRLRFAWWGTTGGGWPRRSAASAAPSERRWNWRPTGCSCASGVWTLGVGPG